MSAASNVIPMTSMYQAYLDAGFALCEITSGKGPTGMGWNLPPESIAPALQDWAKWGQARHSYFLRATDLARAVGFVAETPRGGVVISMELQPEAPLSDGPVQALQLKYLEES